MTQPNLGKGPGVVGSLLSVLENKRMKISLNLISRGRRNSSLNSDNNNRSNNSGSSSSSSNHNNNSNNHNNSNSLKVRNVQNSDRRPPPGNTN